MAIKTSYLEINKRLYILTSSNLPGYGVMREGIIYYEAVDPADLHREYTEVKLPEDMLPKEEEPQEGQKEDDVSREEQIIQ